MKTSGPDHLASVKETFPEVSAIDKSNLDFEELGEIYRVSEIESDSKITEDKRGQVDNLPQEEDLSTEPTLGFSETEKLVVAERLKQLKNLIETRDLDPKVVDFLLSPEVSTVIAGVRPGAYLQPSISDKKAWQVWKEKSGLNDLDYEDIDYVLQELGITSYRLASIEDRVNNKSKNKVALLHIMRLPQTLEAMKASGLFSEEEIGKFIEDPELFHMSHMNGPVNGYAAAARVGVLYGYPLADVKDFIQVKTLEGLGTSINSEEEARLVELKNKEVSGHNQISWKSTNFESAEVQDLIEKINEAMKIQQEIFSGEIN